MALLETGFIESALLGTSFSTPYSARSCGLYRRPRRRCEVVSVLHAEASSDVVENAVTRRNGVVRVAVPSKGNMFDQTRELLREIGCDLMIANPRQYIATLRGLPRAELWLQRPADIARKVADGTVDLGFTGYDLVAEYAVRYRE